MPNLYSGYEQLECWRILFTMQTQEDGRSMDHAVENTWQHKIRIKVVAAELYWLIQGRTILKIVHGIGYLAFPVGCRSLLFFFPHSFFSSSGICHYTWVLALPYWYRPVYIFPDWWDNLPKPMDETIHGKWKCPWGILSVCFLLGADFYFSTQK